MAQTYLSAVPDVSFRMEQLADFLTGTFENYLPWALGSVLAWANEDLVEHDPTGVPHPSRSAGVCPLRRSV